MEETFFDTAMLDILNGTESYNDYMDRVMKQWDETTISTPSEPADTPTGEDESKSSVAIAPVEPGSSTAPVTGHTFRTVTETVANPANQPNEPHPTNSHQDPLTWMPTSDIQEAAMRPSQRSWKYNNRSTTITPYLSIAQVPSDKHAAFLDGLRIALDLMQLPFTETRCRFVQAGGRVFTDFYVVVSSLEKEDAQLIRGRISLKMIEGKRINPFYIKHIPQDYVM